MLLYGIAAAVAVASLVRSGQNRCSLTTLKFVQYFGFLSLASLLTRDHLFA